MRIVLGIGSYSHGYGMPYVVQTLAKELQDKGHDVFVLTGKSNIRSDVKVVECGYIENIKHASICNALKKISCLKPDIFHSHYYPMDFCGALASSSTKHVMHVHGVLSKEYWANIKATLDCTRALFSESFGIRYSSKIVTISNFLKLDILNRYNIYPEKIEVIYPSIDLDKFSPNNRLCLQEASNIEDGIRLISVGALSERKGQHLLVDAMAKIVKDAPKTRLSLIGRIGQEDTNYIFHLRERIRKYHLEENVFIEGFLPLNLLPNAYAQADIFVTGTMWEGFGLPLAEAMATGIPVVAFDTASMAELIVNEFNGLKVPPFRTDKFAESVLRLIQDTKEFLNALAEMGGVLLKKNLTQLIPFVV